MNSLDKLQPLWNDAQLNGKAVCTFDSSEYFKFSTLSALTEAEVFIVLKLTDNIDWSWWIVLLPFWGGWGLIILFFILIIIIGLIFK